MRRGRVVAPLLAAALAAIGLAACGGGGGSSTSTPAASAAATPTATTGATTPTTTTPATTATATTPTTTSSTPTAAAKPAETAPQPSTTSTSPSSGSGGGAASFRAPSGDDSIPDYGSEASPSEREHAATALAAFLRARANGEWATACTYLAATTRKQFERLLGGPKAKAGGCARVLAALSKSTAAHAETLTLTAGVAALRIKATSAFALFHGPKGSKYVMPMRSEGGAWKMSQLAPLPYPLGSAGSTP
jgi:hypothetical protein